MRVRRDPRGWPGRAALILLAFVVLSGAVAHGDGAPLGFAFKEVAAAAGLTAVTVFGGKDANRYLLETTGTGVRSEEHTSELQSLAYLVCRLLLEKKKKKARVSTPASNRHSTFST